MTDRSHGTAIVPRTFPFRFSVPVDRREGRSDDALAGTPIPDFRALEGTASAGTFELFASWNENGFGLDCVVSGKRHPIVYDPVEPWESDGLTVWLDTRATHNVHRASRYCHQFCLLPGAEVEGEAAFRQLPIARAREDAPTAAARDVLVDVELAEDGYRLRTWFAANALHGFDPESSRRLGFCYHLRDAELGDRFCTVGREFPFDADPSLWITLELRD